MRLWSGQKNMLCCGFRVQFIEIRYAGVEWLDDDRSHLVESIFL